MRIALVSCVKLPEPDPDQALLVDAVKALGAEAEVVAWDDEAVEWSRFHRAVLRSTWNYYHVIDRFLAWAERAARATELLNPLSIVRWNTHKKYLRALEEKGVPVVRTHWVDRGSSESLARAMEVLRASTVVVKPAVSAASFRTMRVDATNLHDGEAHLRALASERDVMVQPYVGSVEGYGERSIVCVDGALTHAIRKSPRFGGERENVSGPLPIADDERALAEKVLAAIPEKLLYARIDVARDDDGRPCIMELELVEPSLFLQQSPAALGRLAAAIAR
ncbi:MAG: ATP-grasp domain-containing protein [Polyangiales bacterium]